jgi:cysteine-rich repeat protein
MWEFCGDGIKQDGPNPDDLHEECDDGAGNSDTVPGACKTDCTVGGCGDGILDPGEQCDVPTCLNGTLCKNNSDCGGERCLPRDGHGRCNSSCEKEKCGDNIVHSMYGEECDDGNTFNDDGCSRLCKVELFSCGDGIVQALGLDGAAGVKGVDDDHDKDSGGGTDEGDEKWWPGSDDEECDYAAPSAKECPGGGAVLCTMEGLDGSPGFAGVDDDGDGVIDDPSEHLWPDSDDETCNLGACNLASDTCLFGGFRCESDADCITPCITTCTESCRKKVNLCGDGYRENGEQCDDGNRTNGDGCSMYCEADRLDLCGNGVVNVAVGEECDQGHLLSTLECTPYCRNPNPAPMCGDGHKDPSGEKRADTLERLLTLSEGYRLDWRAPDGGEVIYPSIDGFDRDPSVWKTIGAGGMYVAPRVFERKLDTPFLQKQKTRLEHDGPRTLDQSKCSLCGNAVLDGNEQCDSGRLSGGSYPNNRVNDPAWRRSIWAWSFSRYVAPYYWNSYYWNIFPYNGYAYEHLISNWYYYRLNWRDYSRLLGRIGWLANGIKDDEGRKFVRENCSGSCRLQLCGNDRIDDGETCDDNNRKFFGGPQDGDGCSNKCVLEEGFKFNGPIIWPNGVIKPITCGDDVISFGEQCDHGGVCERRDGKQTGQYCRLEPGRFFDFCTKNGYDDIFGNDDDHVKCAIVGGNGCDANCQMSPTNICGNSRLEPYEECDNGKQCTGDPRKSCSDDSGCATIGGTCEVLPGDGCDTNCKLEPPGPASCGNGHLDQNGADGLADTGDEEECDAGSAAPTTHCDAFCQRIDGVCGDGKREGAEQCDDGNTTDGDACTNCLFPYCGDDRVDKDEECDDGNMIAKDGCSFCTVDLCGNGRIESGETCDDNNQTSGDGCSEWCILENVCGNGEIEGTEQCDDGNAFSNDGCSGSDRADEGVAACQWEYCGDDIVQPGLGEECDEGEFPPYEKGCSLDCRLPVCGDDIIDDVDLPFPHPLPLAPERRHYKEVCDPGKHCSNDNSIECDDGFECPLGPCNLGDGTCTGAKYKHCTTDLDCGFASCIVVGTAACSAQCTEPVKCGDGFIQGEEQCEPPGTLGCDTECMLKAPEKCGDTRVDTGEDCDDGNRSGHDGCSSTCQTESMKCDSGGGCTNPAKRFVCENGSYCLPSIGCDAGPCTLRPQCGLECVFGICGDKTTDPGEQCDDGRHCVDGVGGPCNTHGDCTNSYCLPVSGDGCSSTCQHEDNVETYYLLRLCQEEVTGFSGQAYQGKIRIGEGQREIWQDTLLHPQGNPFIETSHFFGARHLGTSNYLWWNYTWRWWDTEIHQSFVYHPWSWYWGSRWWPGDWYGGWSTWWGGWSGWWSAWYQNCPSGAFPNSLGNLVQSISGCIDSVSHSQTLPNRARVMPFQPVGLDSYPACQEPRAQLASAVEIPALPPVFIAPYEPSELARDLTTFICQRSSGLTRQAFVFFCEPSERAAPPRYMSDLELLDSQNQDIERELWLSHTLTIGYRASERDLNQYLSEAFAALSSVIKTAVELIDDLQRIKLTDKSCPMDADLTFCTAP